MPTGEVRRWGRGVHVYPWYTWLWCARFLAGWDSCPGVVYSALQSHDRIRRRDNPRALVQVKGSSSGRRQGQHSPQPNRDRQTSKTTEEEKSKISDIPLHPLWVRVSNFGSKKSARRRSSTSEESPKSATHNLQV